jgi:hypothetical protein
MKPVTKEFVKNCKRMKKAVNLVGTFGSIKDMRFSLDMFKMSLNELEKELLENPEAVPKFMDYQAHYYKKHAEVYS